MENFNAKVNEAASKYLIRRGYEIIDEPWKEDDGMMPVDLVAQEDGTIVFVRTKGRMAEETHSFENFGLDQDKLEAFSIRWFENRKDEIEDCPFRFDTISMLVLGTDKALLKHHVNVFCEGSDLKEE